MPMQSLDLALNHQLTRDRTATRATSRALKLWRQIDPQQLDIGWAAYGRELTAVVADAQVEAARQSAPYMDSVGVGAPAEIVPEMFGGVTLLGRELGPELFSAVTTTKTFTGRGLAAPQAFEVGASYLATLIGSAIHDLGRQADSVMAAGKKWTQYVRVLNPGACSRCAILAGKSSNAVAFRRHPRCRCTAFPLPNGEGSPAGFFDTPDAYFESLSAREQDKIFTKSGAEAIRNGADPIKVVNARRGAYGIGFSNGSPKSVSPSRLQKLTIGVKADGSPLQVWATTEGTTKRGDFGRQNFTGTGRRTTTVRLMPEQIQVMAGNDPQRWRKLLIRYGYLV